MIMKTKIYSHIKVRLNILFFISVSIVLVLAIVSCSAGKKAVGVQSEIAPPPPPPPPTPRMEQSQQRDNMTEPEPFTVVEEMPVFPGGDVELLKFIGENIQYPKEAKEKGIQGRVIIRMVVNADGMVTDAVALRGVDPLLDAEAIRVVSSLPMFSPGKQHGVNVPVYFMIPITFALGESKTVPTPTELPE